MLTPQEVSTHVFQKAALGGYNMAMVDEFLDQLTEDYTALFKENAGLKSKMKVLVDKIEEYRSTEDAMRATLLTAQKMADKMIQEAKDKQDQLVADAEKNARVRINELQRETVNEQQRLAAAKKETADFVKTMRDMCDSELKFLEQLPELDFAQEVAAPTITLPSVDEQVESIENSVKAAFDDPFNGKVQDCETDENSAENAADTTDDRKPDKADDIDATRRISFGDLKFGRNYGNDQNDNN